MSEDTNVIEGFDTTIEVKDTSGTYHEIAKCRETDIFSGSRATVDTTHMRTRAGHRTKKMTLLDTDPISGTLIFNPEDPTQAQDSPIGLHYLLKNKVEADFRLTLSSGWYIEYHAGVTRFKIEKANADNIIEASYEITPLEAPLEAA